MVKKTTVKKAPAKKAVVKKPAAKKTPVTKKQTGSAISPLCKTLGAILDENKAEDITMLNLKDKCSFADFMIVASGRSSRHVSALAHYVVDGLKKAGQQPMSVEGRETGDWVLIDAGNIVVHVFRPEIRQFYNIEKMWALPAISG